jgi:PHD/YefM family antitoxin component YafN of YafNO toxin-antitoxin module
MAITTLSSREFNHDASGAKHAANDGPVIITDRGRPAHVLLSYADYKRLTAEQTRIADLLFMPGAAEIAFDPAPLADTARAADFS